MNTTALRKLQRQLHTLQKAAGWETSLGQAIVLLEVAINEGQIITQLAEKVDGEPSHTMVSRAVDILGDHQGRHARREPVGLIERREVPGDRRARGIYLTKKGSKLMEELS